MQQNAIIINQVVKKFGRAKKNDWWKKLRPGKQAGNGKPEDKSGPVFNPATLSGMIKKGRRHR